MRLLPFLLAAVVAAGGCSKSNASDDANDDPAPKKASAAAPKRAAAAGNLTTKKQKAIAKLNASTVRSRLRKRYKHRQFTVAKDVAAPGGRKLTFRYGKRSHGKFAVVSVLITDAGGATAARKMQSRLSRKLKGRPAIVASGGKNVLVVQCELERTKGKVGPCAKFSPTPRDVQRALLGA